MPAFGFFRYITTSGMPQVGPFQTIYQRSTDHPQVVQSCPFEIVNKLCITSLLLLCNAIDLAFFERLKAGFLPTMKFQLSQLP
jgi:hypothetical protein